MAGQALELSMCVGGPSRPPLRPAAGGAQPAPPVQMKPPNPKGWQPQGPRRPWGRYCARPWWSPEGQATVPPQFTALPTTPPPFSPPAAASCDSPRPHTLLLHISPRPLDITPQLFPALGFALRPTVRSLAPPRRRMTPLPSLLPPVAPTSPALRPLPPLPARASRREPRGVRRGRWSGPGGGEVGGGKAAPHTQDGGGGAGVGARDAL